MGYMLYNERMIETYLHAKKWLKPEGKMFPSKGLLYIAPFSDEGLYMEQYNKCTFWLAFCVCVCVCISDLCVYLGLRPASTVLI